MIVPSKVVKLPVRIIRQDGIRTEVVLGDVFALVLEDLVPSCSHFPSLARLFQKGLIHILLVLGVKVCQVVLAKPIQVVDIHRLFLRFLVPHSA